MKFGVLKDIKVGEYRVIATPAEVGVLVGDGHEVYVASNAGYAAGFDDAEYAAAGATVLATNEEIWATCDFVAKVKEIVALTFTPISCATWSCFRCSSSRFSFSRADINEFETIMHRLSMHRHEYSGIKSPEGRPQSPFRIPICCMIHCREQHVS